MSYKERKKLVTRVILVVYVVNKSAVGEILYLVTGI